MIKFHSKRALLCIVLGLIMLTVSLVGCRNKQLSESVTKFGVVIDAGHGGSDPGAISTINGAREDALNLAVAKCVEEDLNDIGLSVTMTRLDNNAVAPTKEEDMKKRRSIIEKSNAALMISIHMNSFQDNTDVWGPQVFYQEGSREGKALAQIIQKALNEATAGTREAHADDLYVLNGNTMPSVLVECGFLTNASEAQKLTEEQYQQLIADAIISGATEYCGYKAPTK